ncbi:NADH dehydrogenase [ubiquinone] 1 alpha subcomplex subunit 12 [Dillenia turbinata]|uniref:NADH dehydrogenase [ubiquinone] 1 alpha subcomplex subunit 12 n=1 Tax=Dillenia turbinata TaxID=194707 RepID=A0AAN8WI20_9MAGN
MSKIWQRLTGYLSNRTLVGVDKAGNRYFTRKEEIDVKEKRWVIFKGEEDPITIPVEWICWLNGQRKKAPTPEEMIELEARRERVRLNVALLKKEEEERRAKEGTSHKSKVGGPDLRSFIQQFPSASEGERMEGEASGVAGMSNSSEREAEKSPKGKPQPVPETSEPTGSGVSFKPGTWQPPT